MASSESLLFYLQAIAIVCCGLPQTVDVITDDAAVVTEVMVAKDRHQLIVQKKSSVLLNCSQSWSPRSLHVEWHKGRTTLKKRNYGPAIRVFQNGSLYIRRARRQHEGIYTCLASNNIGTVIVRNIRLKLAGMAKNFSIEPSSVTGYVGGAARFECEIHTTPPPIYFWQKDSQSLPLEDSKYTTLPSGVLQISDLQESDTGYYRCITSRGELHNLPDEIDDIHLMHSKQAQLRIRKSRRNRRPVLLGSRRNITVLQGETAILECLVDSNPQANITWYRFNDERLQPDFVFPFGSSNLKLLNVDASDEGTYVCQARNPRYSDLKTFINLTVYRPPVMKTKLVSQRWPVDRIVIFTCDVDGNPKPDITWFFNGKKLLSKDKFQVKSDSILNIINAGLEQSGYYQCLASNVAGQHIATARLEIFIREGVPPAPTVTEVRAVSDTSIFLQWEQPGLNPHTSILTTAVYYQKAGGTGGKQTLFTLSNNVTLVDLEPYTNYTIEVKSYNTKGTSVSNSTVVQTLQAKPAAHLHVEPINKTAVLLSWKLNGDISRIKGFDIELRKLQDGQVQQQVNLDPDALQFLLSNLNNGLMYEVTLTVNGIGTRTFGSVTVEFRTLDRITLVIPEEVHADVVDLTTVRLTWLYPSTDDVSFLVCYHVQTEHLQKKKCKKSKKSRLVIHGLQAFHSYRFSVMARLNEQHSPESEACVVQLGEQDVPSAPLNLNYRLLSSEAIELHWSPPLTPNGPITSYIIFYVPNSDDALWKNFTKPGTLTKMRVKELKAAVYFFKVRACNQAGDGDMSRVVSVRLDHTRLEQSVKNLGIIIGLSVGGLCTLCCVIALLFWKFCNPRWIRAQELEMHSDNGYLPGYGNGHTTQTLHEELQQGEKTPMLPGKLTENEQSDAKGAGAATVMSNGLCMNGLLQELKNGRTRNGHIPSCGGTEKHWSLIAAMLASTDGSQLSDCHDSRASLCNPSNKSGESLDDIDKTSCEDVHGAELINFAGLPGMQETDIVVVYDSLQVIPPSSQEHPTCDSPALGERDDSYTSLNAESPVCHEDFNSVHETDLAGVNTSIKSQNPVCHEDFNSVHETDLASVIDASMKSQNPVCHEDFNSVHETDLVSVKDTSIKSQNPVWHEDFNSIHETDLAGVKDTSIKSQNPVCQEDFNSVHETDLAGVKDTSIKSQNPVCHEDFNSVHETDLVSVKDTSIKSQNPVCHEDFNSVHETDLAGVKDTSIKSQTPVRHEDFNSVHETDLVGVNHTSLNAESPVCHEDFNSVHETDLVGVNHTSLNAESPVCHEDFNSVHETDLAGVKDTSIKSQNPVCHEDFNSVHETDLVGVKDTSIKSQNTVRHEDFNSVHETDLAGVKDTSIKSQNPVCQEDFNSVHETDLAGVNDISPSFDSAVTQERSCVRVEGHMPCCNLCLLPVQTAQQPTTSCSCGSITSPTLQQAVDEAVGTSSTHPRDNTDRPPTPPPPLSAHTATPDRLKWSSVPTRKKRNRSRGMTSLQLIPQSHVHNGTVHTATEHVSIV